MFEFFLSIDSIMDVFCRFEVYQFITLIFLCKPLYKSFSVLLDSTDKVIGHAYIEDSWIACKNIDEELIVLFHLLLSEKWYRFSLRKNDKVS